MSASARLIGKALTVFVLIAAVGLVVLLVLVPRITGGAALNVLSGSMTPTIPVGSVVLVVPSDPMAIRPGDVITYQTAPGVAKYVTHRVVRMDRTTNPVTFVTKGDANKGPDKDPVPVGAVRGVVRFHVPWVGDLSDLVKTPLGLMALAAIPALMILHALMRTILNELRTSSKPAVTSPEGLDVKSGGTQ